MADKKIRFRTTYYGWLCLFYMVSYYKAAAQSDTSGNHTVQQDSAFSLQQPLDSVPQKDVIDILLQILGRSTANRSTLKPGKVSFIVLPGAGYATATGFSGSVSATVNSYASAYPYQNLSIIYPVASYSQRHQKTLSLYSVIWTKKNTYSFQGNSWYYDYSENTYGLGSHTANNKINLLNYKFIRLYESILKSIGKDAYIGLGYRLDRHYNIREGGNLDSSISDIRQYGPLNASTSSGLSTDFLIDSRRNPNGPLTGMYLNIVYSPKMKALGSDNNWQSLKVDARKYIKTTLHSDNVFAVRTLLWFTLSGVPPYLDLPGTGWDEQQKTGRGYTQGRFRGRNMIYAEGEYRFRLTRNGLIGAVVFANAQSFSESPDNRFDKILPAAGGGLRIKFNKYSRTNLCLDYGVGINGSRGLFVSLGEVF